MNEDAAHEITLAMQVIKLKNQVQTLTDMFDRSERAVVKERKENARLRACMEEAVTQLTGDPDSLGWIAVELLEGLVYNMEETPAQELWRKLTSEGSTA